MLGWAIEVLALALPLLTGTRLARTSESSQEALLGSEILLDLLMIWSLSLAAVLGFFGSWFVAAARQDDPTAAVRASTWRMLVVLAVAAGSLWLVEPPDFVSWGGAWRRLATFLAVGPVPLWACSSLLRLRGVGLLPSLAVSLGVGAVAIGGTWLLGQALFLHDQAALAPLGAVGVVTSVGLTLANWERVPGRWGVQIAAISAIGVAVAAAMSFFLTRSVPGTAWVEDIAVNQKRSGRVLIIVTEPNTRPRILKLDREPTITVEPLHPRAEWVTTSGEFVVQLRRTWPSVLLRQEWVYVPCASGPRGEVCIDHEVRGQVPLFAGHPRRDRVVVVSDHELLGWDLNEDRVWLVKREGQVRWPCMTSDGRLIWRMQTESGPYRHETFAFPEELAGTPSAPGDATAGVQSLPLDHGGQCDAGSFAEAAGTFVRGRERLGRLSMLTGPGLPEEGVHVEGTIGTVRWSYDGTTAALVTDSNAAVRFYNAAWGLTDPLPIPELFSPELSVDGRWMSRPVRLDDGSPGFEVMSVPDGQPRFRRPSVTRARFDGRGGILQVWQGDLSTVDAETGEATLLYPPP